jgi:hypothetical protein
MCTVYVLNFYIMIKNIVGLYEYLLPRPHYHPSVFITFSELLVHVIFQNTELICTHGRTGVRLVTPLDRKKVELFIARHGTIGLQCCKTWCCGVKLSK